MAEPLLSAYLNAKGCREALPVSGNFELTARCNFSCPMCYVHTGHSPAAQTRRELTTDEWLALAAEARERGMLFLLLTGGEPLLREDFPKLYEALIKMGLMISINTNASLYTPQLRKLFLRHPPARIHATLYGAGEETYAAQCGRPAFSCVLRNLQQMKADGLPVGLNVSFTPCNIADMESVAALARKLDLPARAACYMYPPVRSASLIGHNPGRLSPEEAGRAMARWHRIWDDRQPPPTCTRSAEQSAHPHPDSRLCRAGRSSFWITWDGRMLPCGTMGSEGAYPLRVGFDRAWEQTRAAAAAFTLPALCRSCSRQSLCPVCPSACLAETGGFAAPPPYLCAMAAAMENTLRQQAAGSEESP